MAITYKDISELTQKSAVAGTEKLVVSDTEYITPRMLAGRITGFVASNVDAGTTQYVIAKTNLAAENSHRFVFEVIGNSYDGNGPIHSVIQAVNTPSQSAFVSGWTQAVNMGKPHTYYVANINGYVCLYFQIIAGVSVWVSCHSGGNLDNRVTEVTMQSSAPTYTWRATATNTNLSGFLPLAGGTMTGSPVLSNAVYLAVKDSGGTARNAFGINSSNQLLVGYATAGQSYETHLYGGSINFHYGSARTVGLTLDSSGNVAIPGVTTITKDAQQPLVVKRDAAGSTQYAGIGYQTSDTNLGAIGMNGVGEAFVRSGSASTYYRIYTSKNITISSSDPTSGTGSDGDIWIKI